MRPPGVRKIQVRYSQRLSGLGAVRDHLRHRDHVGGGFQEGESRFVGSDGTVDVSDGDEDMVLPNVSPIFDAECN
jgi:hypothetical protein